MSEYSMTVSEMLDMWTRNQAYNMRDKIEKGRSYLFDFDYEIFDPAYKSVFETAFIRNFYMTEIGFETEGRFKFELETWLMINMPYFNKMFESELITFDPLINTDIKTTGNKKNNRDQTQTSETKGTSQGTSETTGESTGTREDENNASVNNDDFNRKLVSDTPDSRLTITSNDGEGVIEYATSIEENNNNEKQTSNSTGNSNTTDNSKVNGSSTDSTEVNANATENVNQVEDYLEQKLGKVGSQNYSEMLNDYRGTFLRIQRNMFDEMRKELFMVVY